MRERCCSVFNDKWTLLQLTQANDLDTHSLVSCPIIPKRLLSSKSEDSDLSQRKEACKNEVAQMKMFNRTSSDQITMGQLKDALAFTSEPSEGLLRFALERGGQLVEATSPDDFAFILKVCTQQRFLPHDAICTFLTVWKKSKLFSKAPPGDISARAITHCVHALALLHKLMPDLDSSVRQKTRDVMNDLALHMVPLLKQRAFGEIQVSKLVYGLGVLQFREMSLLEALMPMIESRACIEKLTSSRIARLVYGVAYLGVADFYTLQPTTDVILRQIGVGCLSDIDLASLLHCAVKMDWKNDDFDLKLAREACRWERLENYRPRTFASICLSLGHMQRAPNPSDVDRCVNYIKKHDRAQTLDSQSLSQVAFGMKLLNISDSDLWTSLSQEALKPTRLKCFTDERLSILVHSFGSCSQQKSVWDSLATETLERRGLTRFSDASIAVMLTGLHVGSDDQRRLAKALLVEISKPERIERLSEKNLVGAFGVLCQLDSKDADVIKTVGSPLVYEIMNCSRRIDLSPQSIAQTVYALGKVKNYHLVTKPELCAFVQKALDPSVASLFKPQEWTCLIFGLGELRLHEVEVLDSIVQCIFRAKLRTFSSFELCNVFFGLGRCGYHRMREVGSLLGEILKSDRMAEMNGGNLATLMLALYYHRVEDGGVIQEVMEKVVQPEILMSLSLKQLSVILYSLASSRAASASHVEQLVQRVLLLAGSQPMSDEHLEQLSWLMYSLKCLVDPNNGSVWEWIDLHLRSLEPHRLERMKPQALSSMLKALTGAPIDASSIRERLIERLMRIGPVFRKDNATKLRTLESIVSSGSRRSRDAEKMAKALFPKCRVRDLSLSEMLRLADSLFRARLLERSPYSGWFLSELLFYKNGILMSRFSNQQLLYLVSLLRVFAQQQYPYFSRLLESITSELFSIARRDSIEMEAMIQAVNEITEMRALRPEPPPHM